MQSENIQNFIDSDRVEKSCGVTAAGYDRSNLSISTDRYVCRDYAEREREKIWMKVWQPVGRVDEIPNAGDWKEYSIYDQSFIAVRGSDGEIRAFVNACTHRGNVLCAGDKGNAPRFTCPYHKWSFANDGRLVGVGRPDLVGPLDKSQHGLIPASAGHFGGFLFINPDPNAVPLTEFLGEDFINYLSPYKLEEMTPVMDVREALDCNWKVVNDAFQEGYHIDGIHPQLLGVIVIDPSRTRFNFTEHHNLAVAPFDVEHGEGEYNAEEDVAGIRALPETFPGTEQVMPAFNALVEQYRDGGGALQFPQGVNGRSLLQLATRQTLSAMGLDVSGLTNDQMSDNHGYLLFPNFFMTVRAGECHTIWATPHPDGDPNRCYWRVSSFMWLPEGVRNQYRVGLTDVTEPGTYPYFLALQQDYEQMPRQQKGLRNKGLKEMSLAQEEICIAHFHSVVDRYMNGND